MPENIHASIQNDVPTPDPKTNGRGRIVNDMSDDELNSLFELSMGQCYLMQDNIEHGLEAARVWG